MNQPTNFSRKSPARLLNAWRHVVAVLLIGAGLSGCGGGESTVENPNISTNSVATIYTGPAPATADVQSFRINVWDNLKDANRCGSCHGAGGQVPQFVRQDDHGIVSRASILRAHGAGFGREACVVPAERNHV